MQNIILTNGEISSLLKYIAKGYKGYNGVLSYDLVANFLDLISQDKDKNKNLIKKIEVFKNKNLESNFNKTIEGLANILSKELIFPRDWEILHFLKMCNLDDETMRNRENFKKYKVLFSENVLNLMLHEYCINNTSEYLHNHLMSSLMQKKEIKNININELEKHIEKHGELKKTWQKYLHFQQLCWLCEIKKDNKSIFNFLDNNADKIELMNKCREYMLNNNIDFSNYKFKKFSLINNIDFAINFEFNIKNIMQGRNCSEYESEDIVNGFVSFLKEDYKNLKFKYDKPQLIVYIKEKEKINEIFNVMSNEIKMFEFFVPEIEGQQHPEDYIIFFKEFYKKFTLKYNLENSINENIHKDNYKNKI